MGLFCEASMDWNSFESYKLFLMIVYWIWHLQGPIQCCGHLEMQTMYASNDAPFVFSFYISVKNPAISIMGFELYAH